MGQPYSAAGAQLKVATASPQSYIDVTNVDGLQYGNSTKPQIDVTPISETVAARTVPDIPGVQTLDGNLFYDPDEPSHALMLSAYNNDTLLYWQDNHNNSGLAVDSFAGYVTKWDRAAQKGQARMISFTVSIDGAINTAP